MVAPYTASYASRIAKLRGHLKLEQGEAVLVTSLKDIRWLVGFSGSNAVIVIDRDGLLLVTDGRYAVQVGQECPGLDVKITSGNAFASAIDHVATEPVHTVHCQANHITWEQSQLTHSKLQKADLQPLDDPLPEFRASKTEQEIRLIEEALEITESVYEECLGIIEDGMTELDLAAELDYRQRIEGGQGQAFDTIVAFGENAALPHARPSARKLAKGDVILMDFGCVVDWYHSDMTRTVFFGAPTDTIRMSYMAVKEALEAAAERASSGLIGATLDAVARDLLSRHGLGSFFQHSLGHGVGLDIHEFPTLSSRGASPIPDFSIITLEPGVYIPGEYGIRIENMGLLSPDGCRILNRTPIDPIIL